MFLVPSHFITLFILRYIRYILKIMRENVKFSARCFFCPGFIWMKAQNSDDVSTFMLNYYGFLSHFWFFIHSRYFNIPSLSSCSLRVRCVPCSLVLKLELVPPSLLRSSNVPSSFWSVLQCLSWQSISVHPLYVL